jgi:hypothetical protein
MIWVGTALKMECYTNMTFNQRRVLPKHALLMQLLLIHPLFYVHSISKHDEQNILNL